MELELKVSPEELREFEEAEGGDVRVVEKRRRRQQQFCEECQTHVSHLRAHFLNMHCPGPLFFLSYCWACRQQCGSDSSFIKFHAECPPANNNEVAQWVKLTSRVEDFFIRSLGLNTIEELALPLLASPFTPGEKLLLSLRVEMLSGGVQKIDHGAPSQRLWHWRSLYSLLLQVSAEESKEFRQLEVTDVSDGPPVRFADAHFHVDKLYQLYPWTSLQQMEETDGNRFKLEHGVTNFVFPENWGDITETLNREPQLMFSIGIHPNRVPVTGPMPCFKDWLRSPRCVGVGEVGLDSTRSSPRRVVSQLRYLEGIIGLVKEFDKALVLHCRGEGTVSQVLTLLKTKDLTNQRIHWHCFDVTREDAKNWLGSCPNVYFGISPLCHKDPALLRVVGCLPLDRIVLESDAPYLPHGATPWSAVRKVAMAVADQLRIPVRFLVHQAVLNTRMVYGIRG